MSVRLENVRRRFGEFALEDVTLSLGQGEYWVLLGPSGCGKSMLLQTLSGLFLPDGGRIVIAGEDRTEAPPEERNVGLVFQQAALFPHYSVRGNVEYGLKARGVASKDRKRRVDEMIEGLRLNAIVDRPVATLSGGEAQRVAIARALAIRPAVLLLDEPLSLVDHNTRLELQSELKRVHKAFGLTTLHVTHSRDEAQALGDHCAVMLGGRLVQRGATDEIFARPRCPFVARFLGREFVAGPGQVECEARCLEGARCTAPSTAC